eukprot:6400105-Prymnesium_polylepis.1
MHEGVLNVALSRGQAIERIRLEGVRSRVELERRLRPHPKVLIMLAALGREVPVERLREAVRLVLDSERRWAQHDSAGL